LMLGGAEFSGKVSGGKVAPFFLQKNKQNSQEMLTYYEQATLFYLPDPLLQEKVIYNPLVKKKHGGFGI